MSHLVLNVFGWLGVTVLGTLVLLWPTVLHARVPDSVDSAARRALVVLLAGLAVASAGPVLDLPVLVTLGMATWVAGAGLLAIEGWRESRSMPPATFAGWSLAAAFVWVLVGAIILGVLAAIAPDWESLRSQYLAVLGPLVVGFGTQIVIGALSYLLPVVALGSPSAAKAGAEILDRGAAFRVVAFNGAIALYLTPMPSLARVLLSLVVAGVATPAASTRGARRFVPLA